MFAVHPDEARKMIALTYGMISMVDDAVGHILQTLEVTGLADNTIIIFTSDHGDLMGDHGLMLKGPIHYQGLIRVPFIWHDPRTPSTSARTQSLSSSVDIAPTVLAAAGIAPIPGMQGINARTLPHEASPTRDVLLIEEESQRAFLGFSEPIRARTLVTDRYRMTLYRGAEWGELYDLAADPHEEHNLWACHRHAGVRTDLMTALAHKLMETVSETPRPTQLA